MSETDWQRSADACELLDHLFPQRGMDSTPDQPRKLRLYLTAICRANWEKMPGLCRAFVEIAEEIADATQGERVLWSAAQNWAEQSTYLFGNASALLQMVRTITATGKIVPQDPERPLNETDWQRASWAAFYSLWPRVPPYRHIAPHFHRADLVRCVFGNPFRHPNPETDTARWRSDIVRDLTLAIYEERAFERLPILADALEEAGCNDPDVLNHCREETLHSRGCWVVDSLLNR